MSTIKLFHMGFDIIEKPDLKIGRSNADFGQGFYLSDNEEFSKRWAQERRGLSTYLNSYEMDLTGLKVKRFSRDEEWFRYISSNRANRPDDLADYDIITGPIANDTIYATWGIITSGWMKPNQALRLLTFGPLYKQIAVKTERATDSLHFIGAEEMTGEEIAAYKAAVLKEEAQFQEQFITLLGQIMDFDA